jgi:hypothetical protein
MKPKSKSMRELVARQQYKIVQRYIDTFNKMELDLIADYIEERRNQSMSDYPQALMDYAVSVGASIEKDEDGNVYTVAQGKRVRRIDDDGNIFKPRGKKILGSIYDD